MRNAALEAQWVAAAQAYLKSYPHGQYAFEPRFRLGELYQHKGDYLDAAHQYEQVAGNPDYDFTARFNAAECYYRAWTAANAPPAASAAANAVTAQPPANNASAAAADDHGSDQCDQAGTCRRAWRLSGTAKGAAMIAAAARFSCW